MLLFKNSKTTLSVDEQNWIYEDLKLRVAPDKKGFMVDEFPVAVVPYPTDLNKDGTEEMFIGLNSSALYGDRENFLLYTKNKNGRLVREPEISGGRPFILTQKNQGYADIGIGGPGFEFPTFRWNGTQYKLYKSIKIDQSNEKSITDIGDYSKQFTDSKN